MSTLREYIENGFGRWAQVVSRRPWLYIVLMLSMALLLGSRVPLMEIETSTEDYLFDSDPAKIAYDAFREQYGRDQGMWVLIEPPEIFDIEFLQALIAMHEDFEATVPYLSEVTSLYNIRSVRAEGDELRVDDLLDELPTDDAEMAALRARVMSTPSYLDTVISADGKVASLIVEAEAYAYEEAQPNEVGFGGRQLSGFEADEAPAPLRFLNGRETSEFCRAVLAVVERHRREGFDVQVTGQPILAYALTRAMADDVPRIFGGALLIIGVLIVVLFRRMAPVVLALTIVVLALMSTLGAAQLFGIPVSLPTQIVPSFILAVGVGYVVHILTIFYRALLESGDRAVSVEVALRHTGLPILMTAVTTAAGLVAFVAAEMEQVLHLGITGAIGVLATFMFSLGLLPALLVVLPVRPGRSRGIAGGNRFLSACARAAIHHPRACIGVTAIVALGAIALLPWLDYSSDSIRYFPEGHWLRSSTEFADERMGGMQSLEIVVDTGRKNGLHDPSVLKRMEALEGLVEEYRSAGESVGGSVSVLDILKETNRALNEDRAAFYSIPDDRALIAQELLLFEQSGSDDLEEMIDSQFSQARISVRTNWEDGVEKSRFLARVTPEVESTMGDEATVQITGVVALIARIAEATSESLIRSYTLALALITPLMIILIGRVRAGLVSMVPNLVPVFVTLGLMVVVGIELDMFTLLGACIAIGLAVDDSIHFISGFQRHLKQTGDPEAAVELTMATTGRALLFTSVVLSAGFVVLGLSSMSNLANLGMLTAFAIGLAFLLDVTVTPALLVLTHRK